MPTRRIGSFDEGRVRFEVDYGNNMVVTAVRCINNSDQAAYGQAIRQNPPRKAYEQRFPPNQTVEIGIPTHPNDRLQYVIDEHGRFGGVNVVLMWPYP
jgi:hypothetical protein